MLRERGGRGWAEPSPSPDGPELPRPCHEGGKLHPLSRPSLQVPWAWPPSWPRPLSPAAQGHLWAVHPQCQLCDVWRPRSSRATGHVKAETFCSSRSCTVRTLCHIVQMTLHIHHPWSLRRTAVLRELGKGSG